MDSEYWEFEWMGKDIPAVSLALAFLDGHSGIERLTMCDAKRKASVDIFSRQRMMLADSAANNAKTIDNHMLCLQGTYSQDLRMQASTPRE